MRAACHYPGATGGERREVTGGRSGIQAFGGKGSAKHATDAGVMTACYSAPQPLAALRGASPDTQ